MSAHASTTSSSWSINSLSSKMPAAKRVGSGHAPLRADERLLPSLSRVDKSSMTQDKEEKNPVPFVEEDGFTDLVLIVDGKRLFTSRALLSMSSPVFARMLVSPEYKEKKEVPLSGKSFDTIQELLYILHPAYQRKITDESAFIILTVTEEYQMWNLKQRCEETLLLSLSSEKTIKEELLLKCLHVSDQYKLFALWTKCLQLCSKANLSLVSLQRNPEYENLSRFLRSMLEAFKASSESVKSPNDGTHHIITSRRGSTAVIDETNVKKSFSNCQTQTKI